MGSWCSRSALRIFLVGRFLAPSRRVWPSASVAAGFLRPRAELLRHRACDIPDDSDCRTAGGRRDAGQYCGRQRARRGYYACRPTCLGRRFGMLGAMVGAGLVVGPLIGGLLATIDLRLPFYAAGSLSLLNLLYGCFVLPESLPAAQRRSFRWKAANPYSTDTLRGITQLKGAGRLVAAFLRSARFFAHSGIQQHVLGALHDLQVRLGTTGKRVVAGGGGLVSAVAQARCGAHIEADQPAQARRLRSRVVDARARAMGCSHARLDDICNHIDQRARPDETATIRSVISGAADAKHQGKTLRGDQRPESLMTNRSP